MVGSIIPSSRTLIERTLADLKTIDGLDATPEPAHPLRTAAVGEAFGHDGAPAALLQGVVADLGGGVQRLLDVALLQPALAALRQLGPDAGKAVRLQLQPDAERVHFTFRNAAPGLVELGPEGGVVELQVVEPEGEQRVEAAAPRGRRRQVQHGQVDGVAARHEVGQRQPGQELRFAVHGRLDDEFARLHVGLEGAQEFGKRQQRLELPLAGLDVYVNVAGGLRLTDPGTDLAVALAVYSAVTNRPLPEGTADDWVQLAYDDVPASIWPVAKRSLQAHVERLQALGHP